MNFWHDVIDLPIISIIDKNGTTFYFYLLFSSFLFFFFFFNTSNLVACLENENLHSSLEEGWGMIDWFAFQGELQIWNQGCSVVVGGERRPRSPSCVSLPNYRWQLALLLLLCCYCKTTHRLFSIILFISTSFFLYIDFFPWIEWFVLYFFFFFYKTTKRIFLPSKKRDYEMISFEIGLYFYVEMIDWT